MNGSGVQSKARNAGIDDAQWMPRWSYMYGVNRGKTAAKTARMRTPPARTDAAKMVYESRR